MEFKEALRIKLRTGKDRPITGMELAKWFGHKDTRVVRIAISELVDGGLPVIGDSARGYYIASNREECQRGMADLRSRLIKMALRRRSLKRAMERHFTGQIGMF